MRFHIAFLKTEIIFFFHVALPSALAVSNPLLTLPCDFENGLCPGYEVDRTADFEWMLMTGPTSSSNTGPDGDNTPGLNGNGMFLLCTCLPNIFKS